MKDCGKTGANNAEVARDFRSADLDTTRVSLTQARAELGFLLRKIILDKNSKKNYALAARYLGVSSFSLKGICKGYYDISQQTLKNWPTIFKKYYPDKWEKHGGRFMQCLAALPKQSGYKIKHRDDQRHEAPSRPVPCATLERMPPCA